MRTMDNTVTFSRYKKNKRTKNVEFITWKASREIWKASQRRWKKVNKHATSAYADDTHVTHPASSQTVSQFIKKKTLNCTPFAHFTCFASSRRWQETAKIIPVHSFRIHIIVIEKTTVSNSRKNAYMSIYERQNGLIAALVQCSECMGYSFAAQFQNSFGTFA